MIIHSLWLAIYLWSVSKGTFCWDCFWLSVVMYLNQVAAGGAGGWCFSVCWLGLAPSAQSHSIGQSSSCPSGTDAQRSHRHSSAWLWAVQPERFPQVSSGFKWLVILWLQHFFLFLFLMYIISVCPYGRKEEYHSRFWHEASTLTRGLILLS